MMLRNKRYLLPVTIIALIGLALISCNDDSDARVFPFDYCGTTPPDAMCWKETRDPGSDNIALAEAIADKHLADDPAQMKWDWGETVLMLGMYDLYRVTGKAKYLNHIRAWMDHHIENGYEIGSSDSCAPTSLAVELYRETGEQKYADVVTDALYYLREVSLRTPEGGLNHMGTLDLVGVALWVDSLFMFGNVLTRWGEVSGDVTALDDYTTQFDIFTDRLQKDIGFYKHATEETIFEQEDDVFWGRGNGWVLAAGYDHLRVRYNRGEKLPAMQAALDRLTKAAMQWQDSDSGLWWTVMNHPGETYLETSVAALFSLGMARAWRYGYQDDSVLPVIAGAIRGVKSRIVMEGDDAPVVTGVSGPTNPSTLEVYGDVRQRDDISYGVGAVIMSLVETSGLPLETP